MQDLNLSTADAKIINDIRRYLAEVQPIIQSPVETTENGIQTLIALRKASYEDLNQILHEYAALAAVRWLIEHGHASEDATWQWNPRQTGDVREPDIRAILRGTIIISGEVTTSPQPKGLIDTRMASTLKKLAAMQGKRFYFVLTVPMAKRARTKVAKAGYNLDVVELDVSIAATITDKLGPQ